jgi:hypothetical protein
MKNIIIGGIICAFIIDLIYKNCIQNKKETTNDSTPIQNDKTETKIKENIANQIINNKEEYSDTDDEIVNEYDELLLKDEDDEFEGDIKLINKIKSGINRKINLKIVYDPERFSKHCEILSKYIEGNFTNNENFYIKTEKFQLSPSKNFKVQLITFSQLFIIVFLFTFPSLKRIYSTVISEKTFDRISSLRFFLIAGFYFLHQYFIRKYSYSYAFEVYVNNKLHFSAIQSRKLPTFKEIANLLEEIYGLVKINK